MNSVTGMKVLLLVAAAGAGYNVWQNHRNAQARLELAASTSPGQFIRTAMPDGAAADTVLILAPVNCPSEAAKRADALSDKLTQLGIPNKRGNSFQLHVPNPTPEQQEDMKRAAQVLQGTVPAVFINGMGKSNPTAEDVVQAYRSSSR